MLPIARQRLCRVLLAAQDLANHLASTQSQDTPAGAPEPGTGPVSLALRRTPAEEQAQQLLGLLQHRLKEKQWVMAAGPSYYGAALSLREIYTLVTLLLHCLGA